MGDHLRKCYVVYILSRTTLERERQTPLQTRGTALLGLSRILVFSLVRSTPDNGIFQAKAKHRVDLEMNQRQTYNCNYLSLYTTGLKD